MTKYGADSVFVCVNKTQPGIAEHTAHGKVTMGMHDPAGKNMAPSKALEEVANAFRRGQIEVELTHNLAEARWRKLCWNIPYNGLCTALNSDTEIIRTNPAGRQAINDLMQEVQAAAKACGHHIEDSFLDLMVSNTDEMGPYLPAACYFYRNRRKMELNHLFAKPIEAATSGCATRALSFYTTNYSVNR